MRKMKDSGVAWVGAMPEDWTVKRGKFTLKLLNRPVKETDDVITCFRDGEVTLRTNRRTDGFTVSVKEIGYQGIEPGDLVIHGMDGFAGSIGISDSRGKSSPVLVVCDTDENKQYIMYYLRSMAYNDVFTALATGIRVRSCDLRWNKLAELPYILPSLEEQNQIVLAIESSTSKVDALIVNVQAQIEKLKAYKQSLITEVVTKGLDPNAPMKDSGVEWIGEMPAAWDISRVGLHYTVILGKMLCPKQLDDSYTLEKYYCAANVHFGEINSDDLKEMWFSPAEKEQYHVNVGDMLIVEGGAGAGGCAVVQQATNALVQNSVMIVRNLRGTDNRYLRYWIESLVSRGYIDVVCNKATIPHFTKEKLSKTVFPVLSQDEQTQISDYLDEKCAQIDRATAIKQSKIEKLAQYKRSLIYEYVTGKKEVS